MTAFRRGCATFVLLPGGPPQLNYQRAGPLLGNHLIDTDRGSVEQRFYRQQDLTPPAATLAQLAFALDEHGSPIDYARRRSLFTPSTVTIDLDAYTRLCLQHGLKPRQPRVNTVMVWYLLILLTGEQHDMPGWPKSQHMQAMRFRIQATQPLRAFLHQQARLNLLRHGINDEPVTWEPPREVPRPLRTATPLRWGRLEREIVVAESQELLC